MNFIARCRRVITRKIYFAVFCQLFFGDLHLGLTDGSIRHAGSLSSQSHSLQAPPSAPHRDAQKLSKHLFFENLCAVRQMHALDQTGTIEVER